jgi:hypothetical protein
VSFGDIELLAASIALSMFSSAKVLALSTTENASAFSNLARIPLKRFSASLALAFDHWHIDLQSSWVSDAINIPKTFSSVKPL